MSGDEHPTDPLPDPRAGWVLAVPEEPRPRRRVWPWLVGAGALVLVILVAAVVIVETVVRSSIETGIADQVRTELDLPADHPVDVSIGGALTPQLLAGNLGELRVTSAGVPLGPAAADVEVTLRDVSTSAPYAMSSGTATVSLDQDQVTALVDSVAQLEILELTLDAPAILVSTQLSLFGIGVPVSLALEPRADAGELLLQPSELQVAGLSLTADQVAGQFGALADPVLQEWPVCVAQFLPAGATLSSASVAGRELVATFEIDGRMLQDPALQENGTCA